ncbi:MAG TPA: TolC family protein [Salegentibacter sp.]|uniref:TolC family protein n=1 Tax=Salegentibacter sp. TaxID=1903072 RepID=UPI002F95063D
MRFLSVIIIFLSTFSVEAQDILRLEESYELAEKNYPLARKVELLDTKTKAEVAEIRKDKLPSINLNAQAHYQSEVISFPFQLPNTTMEAPNNDQYRATLDVNQLIYKGRSVNARAALKEAELKTIEQEVAVNLYQLKGRINQLYFSVLLLQEQEILLLSKQEQLESQINEVETGVKYGAVLASSADVLRAEQLKIDQHLIQVRADRKKLRENLATLLNIEIGEHVILEKPGTWEIELTENNRPELELFDLKKQQLEASKEVISKSTVPSLSGFAQAGYGNPGLNMLENSFQDFYMVGLRLSWNVLDWGKNKEAKKALDISQDIIEAEKESFLINNKMELQEAENEILKMEQTIETDNEILALREKVIKASASQLKNGVITSSEYLTEFNKLFESKIDQKVHEIQLALARANFKIAKGN